MNANGRESEAQKLVAPGVSVTRLLAAEDGKAALRAALQDAGAQVNIPAPKIVLQGFVFAFIRVHSRFKFPSPEP
jgi:hypothetical protein